MKNSYQTIIRSLKKGDKIPVYGDGKNIRDWIYVKDSVKIIYNILQNANFNNETYNITFRDERNNIEVIQKILEYFNLHPRPVYRIC